MKYMFFLLLLACHFLKTYAQTTDALSIFEGFHEIILEETTVKDLKLMFPNCRIEKLRYSERLVHLDSLGIEVHCQKEAFKNEYWVDNISVQKSCLIDTEDGIGIGSNYKELLLAYPSILSEHYSRLLHYDNGKSKNTTLSMYSNSSIVTFYADNWIDSSKFLVSQIEIHSFKRSKPITRPALKFMGLPRLEFSSDFKFFSPYVGYGFYTTYLLTGNLGAEMRFSKNSFLAGPKVSLGWCLPLWPGFQVTCSSFVPIKNGEYDIILNPQMGTNLIYGVFYLEAGYNFNLTKNFDIPNSVNLTLGMNIPLNLSKFVNGS